MLDNNALAFVKGKRRASTFFKKHCRIPQEVLHEAEGFPDIDELQQLEYPVTGSVLGHLVEVMASVPVGETRLVNLYANLGNADPLVVATALDGHRENDLALFGPTWTVVTGDKAVQAKAREFGLEVMTNQEFLTAMDTQAAEMPCHTSDAGPE
ncbi:hypothetical protein [Nesterenkonia aurantiaca]|uniref:hypothetical protein n=1 Tax=Nesterenkonia aurantiaca TaxID=1436010 RepID=UPI00105F3021|nr:hypothetical protein [Nesterenkonia aurantiaca]